MFCKVYKENQKELEKMYNLSCLYNQYEFDLQQKQTRQNWFYINRQKKLLSLKPNPFSISFYDTTLGLLGLDRYVLLIQAGDHFIL